MKRNGYWFAPDVCRFLVVENGAPVREWVLVQPGPRPPLLFSLRRFARHGTRRHDPELAA